MVLFKRGALHKRALVRAKLADDATKTGKILVKSSNVAPHVMQKRHAWDKLIKLNGNVQEDFQKVLILLDEHGIISPQYSTSTFKVAEGVIRREHEKMILNSKVKVVFVEYVKTGEIFLNDAWIVTQ